MAGEIPPLFSNFFQALNETSPGTPFLGSAYGRPNFLKPYYHPKKIFSNSLMTTHMHSLLRP